MGLIDSTDVDSVTVGAGGSVVEDVSVAELSDCSPSAMIR